MWLNVAEGSLCVCMKVRGGGLVRHQEKTGEKSIQFLYLKVLMQQDSTSKSPAFKIPLEEKYKSICRKCTRFEKKLPVSAFYCCN